MQETGNDLIIVFDSLSSYNTWCDLLLKPHKHQIPTMLLQPANHVMSVTGHTLKDQRQHFPWSNTGGFDSGNTVTFSSSASQSSAPPLLSTDPFITQTGSVCFNVCSVSLEQPIWVEEVVDKERQRRRWTRDKRERRYREVWWEVRLRRHNRDKPLWNNRHLKCWLVH